MPNLDRRGFLGSLIALAVAPFASKSKPKPTSDLITIDPSKNMTVYFNWRELPSYPPVTRVGETITVRLPKRWKATDSLQPHLHKAMVDAAL